MYITNTCQVQLQKKSLRQNYILEDTGGIQTTNSRTTQNYSFNLRLSQ